VSAIEWVRPDELADFAVPPGRRFRADDENWHVNIERVQLSPGQQVFLNNIEARRDFWAKPMITDHPCLVGQIVLEGRLAINFRDAATARATPNTALLYRRAAPAVHGFDPGPFKSVTYAIALESVERLFDGDIPAALRLLIADDDAPSHCLAMRNRPAMRQLARSLFAGHLNGPLQRMMVEGVMLQLLALQVAEAGTPRPRRLDSLSRRERSAVGEARRRLLADMRDPPSLGELADAVGLTEKRLNMGFRLLFNATVFETLRDHRLELARRLLEQGDVSVKEIAYRVGYDHVSNFIHAFRARYGRPPQQYCDHMETPRRHRGGRHPA
jgi:AraC-like DNA-binding protein